MSDRPHPRRERVRRVQELRRSGVTVPVPSGKAYRRKDKYKWLWVDVEIEEVDDDGPQATS